MFKMIRVNSRTGEVKSDALKKEYTLFGNRGLVAKVMTDEVDPKCDPLGAKNKLIITTGLLAGTTVPTAHRLSVGGKSPLTGTIKEANVGGTVGTFLAHQGIKIVIIEDKPADHDWRLLKIGRNGKAELVPAKELAGLNNYALVEKLYGRYGKDIAVLSIGMAGERGYKNSSLQSTDFSTGHPSRAAGRGGLGAVLGSKKIKAVVIEKPAKKAQVEYADKEVFKAAQKKFIDGNSPKNNPEVLGFFTYGTNMLIDLTSKEGIMPVRNFSGDFFAPKKLKNIKSDAWLKKMEANKGKRGIPCQAGCVVKCSNVYYNAKGEFVTSGLEYETAVLAGPNCDIDDWDYIAEFDRICDDLGIDTIETGATIAVCMEAGKIPWGDTKAAMGLLEEMVKGSAFGNLMGQGTEAVGKKLGVKRIPTCKGQSLAAYDPRALKGIGVTYATSPMGADHTAGNTLPIAQGEETSKAGMVGLSRLIQTMFATFDNMACLFASGGGFLADQTVGPALLAGLYGGQWNFDKMLAIGAQTIMMEDAFNKSAGFTDKDNRLPDFFYTEFAPATGAVFDISAEEMAGMFKY